jgi:hypothetical protein
MVVEVRNQTRRLGDQIAAIGENVRAIECLYTAIQWDLAHEPGSHTTHRCHRYYTAYIEYAARNETWLLSLVLPSSTIPGSRQYHSYIAKKRLLVTFTRTPTFFQSKQSISFKRRIKMTIHNTHNSSKVNKSMSRSRAMSGRKHEARAPVERASTVRRSSGMTEHKETSNENPKENLQNKEISLSRSSWRR